MVFNIEDLLFPSHLNISENSLTSASQSGLNFSLSEVDTTGESLNLGITGNSFVAHFNALRILERGRVDATISSNTMRSFFSFADTVLIGLGDDSSYSIFENTIDYASTGFNAAILFTQANPSAGIGATVSFRNNQK